MDLFPEEGVGLPTAETQTVEFKETWTDDCYKEMAAFANSQGGALYIGIRDNAQILGWTGDSKDQDAIANRIVDTLHVHPINMTVRKAKGLAVLEICMAPSAFPIAVRGRYYQRVGPTSREIPVEELPRFLLERTGQTWDAQPADYGIEALDAVTLADFRILAQERLPTMSPSDSEAMILSKLKLTLPDARMKRAALLLFGEMPQRSITSAQIQIGRFKDEETILDDKRLEGNLFQQLAQAEQILRTYVFVRYEFPTGAEGRSGVEALQREEVWEFPYKAVREAILNALIHRDYTSTGRVMIRVYDDRMIVSNPGGLPPGITIFDLLQEEHESLPRNPILAQVCYYAKLVEQWGSGTIRMRNACRKQGLPDPAFVSTATSFSVTLQKDNLSDETLRQKGMNLRQIQAVHYTRQNGSIGTGELMTLTGSARRTAARDLEQLVAGGIFEASTQSGRAVRYTLIKHSL